MKGTKADVASMLSCMFEGDGHVAKKLRTIRIGYASNSRRMCEQVQDLLLRFKIRSNLTEHKGAYKVLITGHANICRFSQHIKFITAEKNATVEEYLIAKKPIRFVKDSIPNIADIVLPFVKKYYKKQYSGRYGYNDMKYNYVAHGHHIHRMFLQRILKAIEKDVLSKDKKVFDYLHRLAFGSIGWERIKNINRIENKDQQWVYDVTIEPHHTFVSENLVLHNTVSISNANIQATLRAETTVLAAANPKLGRFNMMEPLAPQIDLPPTLINRFDLIFPIKDLPNKEKDERTAHHILGLHQDPTMSEPEIPTALMRKFIAYVRQKVNPKITDQALDEIKTYYVQMRSKGETEDGALRTIPITARQLEALVRLSEASAKVRLSEKVTRNDARRAIELLEYCLDQVAKDSETGQIDIDRISSGISATQRSKIIVIKEMIAELEEQIGKTIPIEDLVDEAKGRGIDKEEVEDVVEKLKRQGDIFEPKRGFIQRIV